MAASLFSSVFTRGIMAAKRTTRKPKAAKRKPSIRKSAPAKRKKPATAARRAGRKSAAGKKTANKAAPARKQAARKGAVRRAAAPKPKAKPSLRKPSALSVNVVRTRDSEGPPPPPEDAVEVSGVWGRVLYSENDPYAEARELFNHYDRNKSGQIEAVEFSRICEALGMEMDDEQLKIGLSIVDGDNDGKIGWDEFLDWWKTARG